jgi:hypothetical protein
MVKSQQDIDGRLLRYCDTLNKDALFNRKALAITVFLSLALLLFFPSAFAITFYTIFGFQGYMFHDAKGDIMITLCSLEGEKGWGLPVVLGNIVYFIFLPLIVYTLLALGMWLWETGSHRQNEKQNGAQT